MRFNSLSYFAFLTFLLVLVTLWNGPRSRRMALLAASYLFYATWSSPFLLLLLTSSVFNHGWGRILRRHPTAPVLWAGISANVGFLASFKYTHAFAHLLLAETQGELTGALIPIGISFYTFQAISYLIDVYRGYEEQPNLVEFLLYMAFWPYILSGPICRLPEMLPQFRELSRPSREDLLIGVRRIFSGLFMKIVLADTLAQGIRAGEGVTAGFDQASTGWGAVDVWFLAFGFGFQMFFDFAGYSHVAIGSARLFGIRLRENFNDPYLSRTPSEFWTRWHMSLSSWIRDYLFFPLAFLGSGLSWRSCALIISMIAFGVWHGAGATFFVWGLYQGLLLTAHRLLQSRERRWFPYLHLPSWLKDSLSWSLTFLFISLGWLLFRSNSLSQALAMFRTLLSPQAYTITTMEFDFYLLVSLAVVGYFAYIATRNLLNHLQSQPLAGKLVWLLSPVYWATVILWVLIWSEETSPFVYVQF